MIKINQKFKKNQIQFFKIKIYYYYLDTCQIIKKISTLQIIQNFVCFIQYIQIGLDYK